MSGRRGTKKVILVIIDSFHPGALQGCLERGLVPALAHLIENGWYNPACVSVFPSVTPTAASSIITGLPPARHQVAGFVWFDRREKRIVNYGSSPAAIFKVGVDRTVCDLLYNLNHRHLSAAAKTVYETLEEAGYTTAAVNTYIFRGRNPKRAGIPFLMRLYSMFRLRPVWCRAPQGFYMGRVCRPEGFWGRLAALPGYPGRWGVNDRYSARVAAWLIGAGRQPDLMTVYFPDTDYYCHSHGPAASGASIVRADRQLGRILNAFPSPRSALRDNIIIVAGDHAQTLVSREKGALIDLQALFRAFSQVQLGECPAAGRDLAVCPNGRMAQIYLLRNAGDLQGSGVEELAVGAESRQRELPLEDAGNLFEFVRR
ncbi:MAG: alkaline phosphatase family protein [Peptococcaceae bacterium]|nr:alkaline phosphatase family protein [Peptococcaceae bacterium]